MGIRYIDEPKKSRIRYLDEPQTKTQPDVLRRGFEAVAETPRRVAPLLPTAGAVGMSMATPGILKGAGMGAVGQLAGEQLKSELQQAPMRGLSRLSPVAGAGLLVPPQRQAIAPPSAIPQALGTAAIGAATGGALKLAGKGISALGRRTVGATKFYKQARTALTGLQRQAGEAFEAGINKVKSARPDARVDLVDDIKNLRINLSGDPAQNLEGNTQLLSIIKRGSKKEGNELLTQLLDEPDLAKSLTLDQARSVIKTIQSSPEIANNLAKGKSAMWTSAQLDALDLIADLKGKTLAQFPELAAENAKYAEFAQKYRYVKPYLREGKLGPALGSNTGMFEKEVYETATKPLLKKAGILPEVESYRRLTGIGRLGRRLLPWALGATGVGYAARGR